MYLKQHKFGIPLFIVSIMWERVLLFYMYVTSVFIKGLHTECSVCGHG